MRVPVRESGVRLADWQALYRGLAVVSVWEGEGRGQCNAMPCGWQVWWKLRRRSRNWRNETQSRLQHSITTTALQKYHTGFGNLFSAVWCIFLLVISSGRRGSWSDHNYAGLHNRACTSHLTPRTSPHLTPQISHPHILLSARRISLNSRPPCGKIKKETAAGLAESSGGGGGGGGVVRSPLVRFP